MFKKLWKKYSQKILLFILSLVAADSVNQNYIQEDATPEPFVVQAPIPEFDDLPTADGEAADAPLDEIQWKWAIVDVTITETKTAVNEGRPDIEYEDDIYVEDIFVRYLGPLNITAVKKYARGLGDFEGEITDFGHVRHVNVRQRSDSGPNADRSVQGQDGKSDDVAPTEEQ